MANNITVGTSLRFELQAELGQFRL